VSVHAFLKTETAEALASTGCIAAAGSDAIHLVDCHIGDEPDEGVSVELHILPGDQMAMF
jgi:hypothetical protein